MRLNPDCVRAILMSVENATDASHYFEYDKRGNTHELLTKYDHNEILYHMYQCNMAELITGFQPFDGGDSVIIGDLTPNGHEFMANIRNDSVWNKTQRVASKIGSGSLRSMVQIACAVVTEIIKAELCIT